MPGGGSPPCPAQTSSTEREEIAMSWVVFPLFALLVLAALPYRSCRLLALQTLLRLLDVGLVASVAGCLVFACTPGWTPGWVQAVADLLAGQLREDLPGFGALERVCGTEWLLLAGFCALLGLPFRLRLAGLVRQVARGEKGRSSRGRPGGASPARLRLLGEVVDSGK
jgi:hypothetical protein